VCFFSHLKEITFYVDKRSKEDFLLNMSTTSLKNTINGRHAVMTEVGKCQSWDDKIRSR
jgi:hypothetical protein